MLPVTAMQHDVSRLLMVAVTAILSELVMLTSRCSCDRLACTSAGVIDHGLARVGSGRQQPFLLCCNFNTSVVWHSRQLGTR